MEIRLNAAPRLTTTLNLDPVAKSLMDSIKDDYIHKVIKEEGDRFEYICRHVIPCPVRGEATIHKVRWHGIEKKILRTQDGNEYLFVHIKPSKSGKRQEFEYPVVFDKCYPEEFKKFLKWQADRDDKLLKQAL